VLKHIQASQSWNEKSLGAKGFTLIELLVVIVILGVLGAVVVFSVRGVTNDSEDAACATEKRTLATAAEAFYAQNGSYPGSLGDLETAGLIQDATQLTGSGYTINNANGKITGTCPA
jgi:general secretion pathway protein G